MAGLSAHGITRLKSDIHQYGSSFGGSRMNSACKLRGVGTVQLLVHAGQRPLLLCRLSADGFSWLLEAVRIPSVFKSVRTHSISLVLASP